MESNQRNKRNKTSSNIATNSNCNRRNQNRCFNQNFKKKNNHLRKKGIEDYSFYIGASKQASNFEITSEFIINYIKQTFDRGNDITESLRTLPVQQTDKWKPKLEDSKATDKKERYNKNLQFKLKKGNLQKDNNIQRKLIQSTHFSMGKVH